MNNKEFEHILEAMAFEDIIDPDLISEFISELKQNDFTRINTLHGGKKRIEEDFSSIMRYLLSEGSTDRVQKNVYKINLLNLYDAMYPTLDFQKNEEFLLTLAFIGTNSAAYFDSLSHDIDTANVSIGIKEQAVKVFKEEDEKRKKEYQSVLESANFQKAGKYWELEVTQEQPELLLAAYRAVKNTLRQIVWLITDEEYIDEDDEDVSTILDMKFSCRIDFVGCQIYDDHGDSIMDEEKTTRITINEFIDCVKAYLSELSNLKTADIN